MKYCTILVRAPSRVAYNVPRMDHAFWPRGSYISGSQTYLQYPLLSFSQVINAIEHCEDGVHADECESVCGGDGDDDDRNGDDAR